MGKKLLTLLDPKLCNGCRFRAEATIDHPDRTTERVVACLRGDCDNWVNSTIRPVNGDIKQ